MMIKLHWYSILNYLQTRTVEQYVLSGFTLLLYLNLITHLDGYNKLIIEFNPFNTDTHHLVLMSIAVLMILNIVANVLLSPKSQNTKLMKSIVRLPVRQNILFINIQFSETFALVPLLITPFYLYSLGKLFSNVLPTVLIYLCIIIVTGNITILIKFILTKWLRNNLLKILLYLCGIFLIFSLIIYLLVNGQYQLPNFTNLDYFPSILLSISSITLMTINYLLFKEILNYLYFHQSPLSSKITWNKYIKPYVSSLNNNTLIFKEVAYFVRSPRSRMFFLFYLILLSIIIIEDIPILENVSNQDILVPFYASLLLSGFADNFFGFDLVALKKYYLSPVKLEKIIIVKNIFLFILSVIVYVPLCLFIIIQSNANLVFMDFFLITTNYFFSVATIILLGNYISIFFFKPIGFKDLIGGNIPLSAIPFSMLKLVFSLLLVIYISFVFNLSLLYYCFLICILTIVLWFGFKIVIQHVTGLLERRAKKIMKEVSY